MLTVSLHHQIRYRKFAVLQVMRIAIDFRITYNNDRALRMFTREFWQDITSSQPTHDFIFLTNEKSTLKLPSNALIKDLKKQILSGWIGYVLGKHLQHGRQTKLITLQNTGFVIISSHQTANAQSEKRILFTGSIAPDATNTAVTSQQTILPALRNTVTSLTWAEAESIKTQYTEDDLFSYLPVIFMKNIS